jgi:hypothetical protein
MSMLRRRSALAILCLPMLAGAGDVADVADAERHAPGAGPDIATTAQRSVAPGPRAPANEVEAAATANEESGCE